MKDIHIQVRDEYATVFSVTAIGTSQQGTQVQTNVTTLVIDLTNGNANGDKTGNIMYEIMPENIEIAKQLEEEISKNTALKKMLRRALKVIDRMGCCSDDGEWCEICQQTKAEDCDLYETFVWEERAKADKLLRE